jgi:hypothetical protein
MSKYHFIFNLISNKNYTIHNLKVFYNKLYANEKINVANVKVLLLIKQSYKNVFRFIF